ncbi:MAG: 5,6-dimethylbenzimidazole synthase [Roseiarcus sp.]
MNREPPAFDAEFRDRLALLLAWRRDVRRFRPDPVPSALIDELLDLAQLAPSVGNSQPWRILSVESAQKRAAVRANFERCNAEALAAQCGERAELYARLKLEGLDAAPVQLAVFCDRSTTQGHGVGVRTMPEAFDYSVAGMIALLWLAARAAGLGLGWISIIDPAAAARDLGAPPEHKLIAYLCLGWPVEEHEDPELVRHGWQERTDKGRKVTVV